MSEADDSDANFLLHSVALCNWSSCPVFDIVQTTLWLVAIVKIFRGIIYFLQIYTEIQIYTEYINTDVYRNIYRYLHIYLLPVSV